MALVVVVEAGEVPAVAAHPGTSLEWILTGVLHGFSDHDVEILTALSLAANRPINWNALGVVSSDPEGHWKRLHASTTAATRSMTMRVETSDGPPGG